MTNGADGDAEPDPGDQVATDLANNATRVSPERRPISPEPSSADDTPMPPGLS
jgi:hypothetical protein